MADASSEHRLALPRGAAAGPYRVEKVLGEGGFGITYLAEHSGLLRKVALKELLPVELATRGEGSTVVARTKAQEDDLTWANQRFVEEARTLARFKHPNIVSVHDVFSLNGTAYMATEYEDGCDLMDWAKRNPDKRTEKDLLAIILPLLDALETIHAQQLLHRDIKPHNIYICSDGRPVLLDFGSARQAISSRSRPITSIITPGYAPFEQYTEEGDQGPWTDFYGLAAVIYFLLVGEKPPDAARRMQRDPYVPLEAQFQNRLSKTFLSAIDWGLKVDGADRPQTAEAWRYRFEAVSASPPPVKKKSQTKKAATKKVGASKKLIKEYREEFGKPKPAGPKPLPQTAGLPTNPHEVLSRRHFILKNVARLTAIVAGLGLAAALSSSETASFVWISISIVLTGASISLFSLAAMTRNAMDREEERIYLNRRSWRKLSETRRNQTSKSPQKSVTAPVAVSAKKAARTKAPRKSRPPT